MPRHDYLEECRAKWLTAVEQAFGATPATSSTGRGGSAIVAALQPFTRAVNHLHFPEGGGHDIKEIKFGREHGTIEFVVNERIAYVTKPLAMTLEYVEAAPAESFIIVELDRLERSDVYEIDGDACGERRSEELVELSPGLYVERAIWDAGYSGQDKTGRDLPLPSEARLVHRLFDGRLMLVTKGSIWNGSPGTYDGRHDRWSNGQIRMFIERAISSRGDENRV